MPHIIILGTLDTKLNEILYLRSRIEHALDQYSHVSSKVTLIDCGRKLSPENDKIDIKQQDLVKQYASQVSAKKLASLSRGDAIKFMADCASKCVKELWTGEGDSVPHGVLSAGGSGGTSLAAAVMREAVPIGVPKMIVSTIASGDTGPIVGETDITMMYSVVDIAGSNELLRTILGNAAAAIAGMAVNYETSRGQHEGETNSATKTSKTRVGVTMFGVTTPCVDQIRQHLEDKYGAEVFVFHATGHGGKAMERLVEEGRLDAVLDITTTEIADYLVGGSMSAGPARLEAALKAGIPNIISLGATDMVNFGPKSTIPERHRDRKFLEHNSSVTLMRTTGAECGEIGRYIGDKVRKYAKRPDLVEIHLPKGGVSIIATPGGAFADAEADRELRETIERELGGSGVRVNEDDRAINDKGFAIDVAESLMTLINKYRGSR